MRPYILDTTVLIGFESGLEPVTARVQELLAGGQRLCLCAITLAEFYTGAPFGSNPAMDAFLARLDFLDPSPEIAATAGAYRHAARAQGRRHGTPDALIAALTKHTQGILLTANVRDFPKDDITVEVLGAAA
jgi:predicted nucleic acid-binding protein